jgi:NAD-dependent dihydropyrimidine dehydrogenase PreA subunit
MLVEIDSQVCDRCGCCVAICPHLAIEISEYLVVINQEKCLACQICVKSCPVGAITNVSE